MCAPAPPTKFATATPCGAVPRAVRAPVPTAAQDAALTNLLQRKGYRDLDAVREAGIEKGIEKALGPLEHQFARRLSRTLTADERATLMKRLDTHGPDRLGDVVLDLDADALHAWLRDPAAT